MAINTSVLARMADPKLDSAYKKAGMSSLPTNIMQALEAKLEKKREDAAAEAAEEILKLYESSDSVVMNLVDEIRNLRARIKKHKKTLEKIARSKAYGAETGNFLPLSANLGFAVNAENKELVKIPEDWNPTVQEEEVAE